MRTRPGSVLRASRLFMPCPFFEPHALLEDQPWDELWTHRPRVPLGERYAGLCHALSGEPVTPSEEHLSDLCNHGYARGQCPHFPVEAKADAVRFCLISEEPLRLMYVLEKDHAPVEHGEVNLDGPDCLRVRQARAFLTSHQRIKLQSPAPVTEIDATSRDNSSKRTDPSERFSQNGSPNPGQAQVEGNVNASPQADSVVTREKAQRKRAKSSAG